VKTAAGHLLNAQAIQRGRQRQHNEHSVYASNREMANNIAEDFGREQPWNIAPGWLSTQDRQNGFGPEDLDELAHARGGYGCPGWDTGRWRSWRRTRRRVILPEVDLLPVVAVAPPIILPRPRFSRLYDYEYDYCY